MSHFEPIDSTNIKDWYPHPSSVDELGQGVYVMFTSKGESRWCPSGNELKRIYESAPVNWLTGPIWLPLSVEDRAKLMYNFEKSCDRF